MPLARMRVCLPEDASGTYEDCDMETENLDGKRCRQGLEAAMQSGRVGCVATLKIFAIEILHQQVYSRIGSQPRLHA